MSDDEFGADDDFISALTSLPTTSSAPKVTQPTPQRITQPTPQRLDRAPPTTTSTGPKIVQPTPQALSKPSVGSSILVSPRQRGNPILQNMRSFPWEYSDILADYVVGATTCALFLSLKYHRLHPEYIYTRIKNLQHQYNLRIILTLVDIDNHEETLRELSKTSLVNNVTVLLCWSSPEAARYLELYKSYEHAGPSGKGIRGQEARGWTEKMTEFVTVPRSINKTDAVSLVSAFGSLKGAVNARPEEVAVLGGWGEKKVRAWCGVVEEPFRVRKAKRREEGNGLLDRARNIGAVPLREMAELRRKETQEEEARIEKGKEKETTGQFRLWDPEEEDIDEDDEEAMLEAAREEEERRVAEKRKRDEVARRDAELPGGVADLLAKLRSTES